LPYPGLAFVSKLHYLDVSQVEVVHDVGHEDVLQESHVLVVVAAEERMGSIEEENLFGKLSKKINMTDWPKIWCS